MTRISLLLLSSAFAVGCASPQPSSSPAGVEPLLASAMLKAARQEGSVSLVLVSPEVSEGILDALERHVAVNRVNSSSAAGLGKGRLLLQRSVVGETEAALIGRLGPVPTGPGHLSCGTGLTVTFKKVGSEWQQGDLQILQC
ncbi:hypothetical protein [Lysobacter sp. N42]|uniref:hypothetical protein n=1 Tax=Lysobacter sp. N42 TaxID=2545719 RepID=UPI0010462A1D|nr:hypothetical protein [Lysobacter sp. N42]TCZ77011.1 hypothetical protein EYQ95_26100 [Lysobacter sp. N42]